MEIYSKIGAVSGKMNGRSVDLDVCRSDKGLTLTGGWGEDGLIEIWDRDARIDGLVLKAQQRVSFQLSHGQNSDGVHLSGQIDQRNFEATVSIPSADGSQANPASEMDGEICLDGRTGSLNGAYLRTKPAEVVCYGGTQERLDTIPLPGLPIEVVRNFQRAQLNVFEHRGVDSQFKIEGIENLEQQRAVVTILTVLMAAPAVLGESECRPPGVVA